MDKFFTNKLSLFVFLFPLLTLYTLFVVFPIIPSLYLSFHNYDGFSIGRSVGLKYYFDVLGSSLFWRSNLNNLRILIIQALIGLPFSLLLALLLDRQTAWFKRFFKISSVLPALLSVTVISQLWIAIYEPQWGILNTFLKAIGAEGATREWLSDESTAIFSVAVAFLWQYLGLNMLLYYTAVNTIPKTYYEAALIDGASFVKSTITITIPLLQEMTKYLMLVSFLGCMAQFAHVRIMTGGGPGDASYTVVYQLFNTAFAQQDFGKGCAISVLFIIECLMITFIINRSVARERLQF